MYYVYRAVIIPCVAGRFFEDRTSLEDAVAEYNKSSSPALRGGSSKRGEASLRRDICSIVIIPCVAGRFFEAYELIQDKNADLLRHHPLRCGAVL